MFSLKTIPSCHSSISRASFGRLATGCWQWLKRVFVGFLFAATIVSAAPPDWTSTSGSTSAVANQSLTYTFTAHDPDGNLTEMEIAWRTPSGGVSSITGWYDIGGEQSQWSTTRAITFNQGPGTYELWVNGRDADGDIRDPWANNIPSERLTVVVSGGNAAPTCTISASPSTIVAGQTVIVSVAGSDSNGNLRYINVDQVSPINGYYGPGDTGTGTPPNNGAYDLGADYYNRTRQLTLTLSNPGTYEFRGAVNDGSGWYYSPSNFIVTVTAGGTSAPPPPTAFSTGSITASGFTAFWSTSANASGYRLDVSTNGSFTSYVPGFQDRDVGNVTSYSVTGLSAFTTYYYRLRAYNNHGASGHSNTISVMTTAASNGTGTGLLGQYFDNKNFTAPVSTRTDARIDFSWGSGSPHASMAPDTFSVRWTGQVQPRYSENYVFTTTSDDGVRLWIDNQLVIDNWSEHPETDNSSISIPLTAGQKYTIRMDFYEEIGGATARLWWQSASQQKEIIPATQLYPSVDPGQWQQIFSASGTIYSEPDYDEEGNQTGEHSTEDYHYFPVAGSPQLTAGTMRVYTTGPTDTRSWTNNYINGTTSHWADSGGPNGNVDTEFTSTAGHYWTMIGGQEGWTSGSYSVYVELRTSATTPTVTSPDTATANYGNGFNGYTITGTNSPTSFAATNLPPGLSVNASTGAITGTPSQVGTWNATITASNSSGTSPNKMVTFSVAKGIQTIAFPAIGDKVFGAPPFAISATASSGLPVTFSVTNGPASISGSTVTLNGVGQVTISATQAGNANYDSAPTVFNSFTVTTSGGGGSGTSQTFTNNGNFTVPPGVTSVELLVVGGGGGGGWHGNDGGGGGGGGGGVIYFSAYAVSPGQVIAVYVGGAGAAGYGASNWPTSGGNSSFGSVLAYGGGAGGNWDHDPGWNGGSGGGGTDYANSPGGSGTSGQGNQGGSGARGTYYAAGGGGGKNGAGSAGNASSGQGGQGGGGHTFLGVVYGAGGGGGTNASSGGGQPGGAGAGTGGTSTVAATSAASGRGSGGGGSGNNNGNGGNGGSGVVIVRYAPADPNPPTTVLTAASSAGTTTTGTTNESAPSMLSVTLGQIFTITSTSSDADASLTGQQIDLSKNLGAWSLGHAVDNARKWEGGPQASHVLSKDFSAADFGVGTHRFRARAWDASLQYSAYQYVDVVVTAGGGGDGPGDGLQGKYFSLKFDTEIFTRVDAAVNFAWGIGGPGNGLGNDNFSVRWTGQVKPVYSEAYTFITTSDDGVRLWVNGQLLIDNWSIHGDTQDTGVITLVAGQRYNIKMEYYEGGGGATARLEWSSSSQPREIIPSSRMYSSSGTTSTGIDLQIHRP